MKQYDVDKKNKVRQLREKASYDHDKVLTMKMSPGRTEGLTTAELTRFVAAAAERLEAQPGIEAAATISTHATRCASMRYSRDPSVSLTRRSSSAGTSSAFCTMHASA